MGRHLFSSTGRDVERDAFGIPLHPVQAYAAMAFLTLSVFLLVWQPLLRQRGDLAGIWLMGTGVIVFITELWRDPEGRGVMLNGAIDGPQLAASCHGAGRCIGAAGTQNKNFC